MAASESLAGDGWPSEASTCLLQCSGEATVRRPGSAPTPKSSRSTTTFQVISCCSWGSTGNGVSVAHSSESLWSQQSRLSPHRKSGAVLHPGWQLCFFFLCHPNQNKQQNVAIYKSSCFHSAGMHRNLGSEWSGALGANIWSSTCL